MYRCGAVCTDCVGSHYRPMENRRYQEKPKTDKWIDDKEWTGQK